MNLNLSAAVPNFRYKLTRKFNKKHNRISIKYMTTIENKGGKKKQKYVQEKKEKKKRDLQSPQIDTLQTNYSNHT